MSDVDVDVASIDANVVESEPQKRAKEDEDEVRIPPSFPVSCSSLETPTITFPRQSEF